MQENLDREKTQTERNKLGQFGTPTGLARDITTFGLKLLPGDEPIRFFDPAVGTGAFFSTLLEIANPHLLKAARGVEIDEHYGQPAKEFWKDTLLEIYIDDFTTAEPPKEDDEKFNLLICNPPYVRHHHIINDRKMRLRYTAEQSSGIRLDGLSGLYCYFIGIAQRWLKKGGIAGWLIPAEFMDVNYGRALKYYLLNQVTLLRIHRFDPVDVQFQDALVSSAVVWYRNEKSAPDYNVEFTFGGTLNEPKISQLIPVITLQPEKKWNRIPRHGTKNIESRITLSSLFTIKRGIATGDNHFFILTREQIIENELPPKFFIPILPGPRYLTIDEIPADAVGNPDIEHRLFLMDCNLPEEYIKTQYPTLWRYLESGKSSVALRYLCRTRNPWYSQEKRQPSQFICTYMGRGNFKNNHPFRFILNYSRAVAPNVYLLLYPKPFLAHAFSRDPGLVRRVWDLLKQIPAETLLNEARVYGGGLYKLEPGELANIPADSLLDLIPKRCSESRSSADCLIQ